MVHFRVLVQHKLSIDTVGGMKFIACKNKIDQASGYLLVCAQHASYLLDEKLLANPVRRITSWGLSKHYSHEIRFRSMKLSSTDTHVCTFFISMQCNNTFIVHISLLFVWKVVLFIVRYERQTSRNISQTFVYIFVCTIYSSAF